MADNSQDIEHLKAQLTVFRNDLQELRSTNEAQRVAVLVASEKIKTLEGVTTANDELIKVYKERISSS